MLDNLTVRHFVGYYGGLVTGISFVVTYSTGSGVDHYTYTFTTTGDTVVAVVIGGSPSEQDELWVKPGNEWKKASRAWKKNESNVWVLQSDMSNVFEAGKNYVKG